MKKISSILLLIGVCSQAVFVQKASYESGLSPSWGMEHCQSLLDAAKK